MKRFGWLILLLALPWLISGCGKGKEIQRSSRTLKGDETGGQESR